MTKDMIITIRTIIMLMMNAKAIFLGIVCLFITSHIFNIFISLLINILVIPTSSYYIMDFFYFFFYSLIMQQSNESHSSIIKNEQQVPSENLSSKETKPSNKLAQNIQNGRQSRFQFERLLNFDYCLLLFCLMNIILSLLYCDADFLGKQEIARWCLLLLDPITILEVIVTIFRYKAKLQLEISQKILQQSDGILSSGKLKQIIFQIFILLIQPYDFLDSIQITTVNIYDNFQFQYKLNYILVVLGFLKVFIALRVLLIRQIYLNPRSSRLCRMYGCESDYLYAIKCLFKDSPLSLVSCVFGMSIFIFSVSLRIAERNLTFEYPKHFQGAPYTSSIANFQNAIWLTILTMTTVGYGDLFPRTLFGRLIDIVLVIWGTFIVSIMVVALTNTLNMDQSEKRALIVLNRLQAKKSLKDAAAYLITNSCKRHLINKRIKQKQRPPLTEAETASFNDTFYKYLLNFQDVHHSIRSMYEVDDLYEEMSRQFQSINEEISLLLCSQQQAVMSVKQISKGGLQKSREQDKQNNLLKADYLINARGRERSRERSHLKQKKN